MKSVLLFIAFCLLQPALVAQVPSAPAPGAPALQAPSMAPAGEELRDVAPPVEVPFWTPGRRAAAAATGLLAAGLMVWAVRAFVNRRRPTPPLPDPLEVALKALERLSAPAALALAPKDYAAAVADVIRVFLENKHGLAATRLTSEEFLETAERSNAFPEIVREHLRHFLGHCDQLKFAGVSGLPEARQQLLSAAFKLVREELS